MTQFHRGNQNVPVRRKSEENEIAGFEDFPGGYLTEGYFDANGNLKVEYVSRQGVESFVKEIARDLTSNQIRRYFGHCRAIETRLRASDAAWEKVIPDVKKLDIAAADGFAKSPPKIPKPFHDFIKSNVFAIESKKDFIEGFLPHFEAIVGFGAKFFRKERS